ncbi:MAG: methionyl-tRNA formyltransferase, partial [Planctomycetes bacterium]|nr:methionyl-tRNA formyltransferase [Planctomycetota bacterium]
MRLVYFGSSDFGLPTLQRLVLEHDVALIVTQPDRPAGRQRRLSPTSVAAFAQTSGIDTIKPDDVNDPALADRIREIGAAALVVIAYGRKLGAALLNNTFAINLHGSLLPKYRGAAPINWVLIDGEAETGVTTMLMDEGLDSGPMLLRHSLRLHPEDTTEGVAARLAEIGARLLVETLEGLHNDSIVAQPQPGDGTTLAPSFKKADGAIDWRAPAVAIDRQVRALQPWPGTFTFWRGERLVLWSVRFRVDDAGRPPGTVVEVVEVGDGGIVVACGAGTLEIVSLQRSGGRRQS